MKLTIELDAEYGVSDSDKEILRALAGDLQPMGVDMEFKGGMITPESTETILDALNNAEPVRIVPRDLAPGEVLQAGDVDPVKYAEAIKKGVVKELNVEIPVSGETATKINQDNVTQISERADLSPVVVDDNSAITIDQITQAEINAGNLPGEELDSKGMPWDARIHSSGKTRIKKDNSWKVKAGVEKKTPGIIAQVEAENKARLLATTEQPAAAEVVIGQPVQTAAAQVFGGGGGNAAMLDTGNPLVQGGGVLPDPTVAPPITFGELLQIITPRQQADPAYANVVNQVLAEFKLTALPQLAGHLDLVAPIAARFEELWQG